MTAQLRGDPSLSLIRAGRPYGIGNVLRTPRGNVLDFAGR